MLKTLILALMTCLLILSLIAYRLPIDPTTEMTKSIGLTKTTCIAIAKVNADRRFAFMSESGAAPFPMDSVVKPSSPTYIRLWEFDTSHLAGQGVEGRT